MYIHACERLCPLFRGGKVEVVAFFFPFFVSCPSDQTKHVPCLRGASTCCRYVVDKSSIRRLFYSLRPLRPTCGIDELGIDIVVAPYSVPRC
jgi:hypothetical protein